MNTPQDAAGPLYKALLAEAQQWACDDADDQAVLDAIDHAPTPPDSSRCCRTPAASPPT
ncbi:hypothetical protein [Streptomyces sp. NPDC001787]|uniref:hypothetical protein n=1 Tax=Streptomyces sp. NPDC001787 TaxID=3154523 RepID=UPI00332F026B